MVQFGQLRNQGSPDCQARPNSQDQFRLWDQVLRLPGEPWRKKSSSLLSNEARKYKLWGECFSDRKSRFILQRNIWRYFKRLCYCWQARYPRTAILPFRIWYLRPNVRGSLVKPIVSYQRNITAFVNDKNSDEEFFCDLNHLGKLKIMKFTHYVTVT